LRESTVARVLMKRVPLARPLLPDTVVKVSVRAVAPAMAVTQGYAARVRTGEVAPHTRHWTILATMVEPT